MSLTAYDPASIKVREIREEARYGGLRVTLHGRLRNARCPVQLDMGYGDAGNTRDIDASVS